MRKNRTAPSATTGPLVLIGGAEDKRGDMTVLRRVVAEAGAGTVLVVPTASDEPRLRAEEYRRAFAALGVAEVLVAEVRTRADAQRPEVVESVERAEAVFFTGGDQVRLVQTLERTRFLNRVRAAHQRGATLAGTSAGAAAAGEVTIYHGDGAGLLKGAVRHASGFGFVQDLVVDTHFDARGRLARLAQFLCTGGGLRGVGLDEDTALVVAADGSAEVVGAGTVTVLDASEVDFTNLDEVGEREPLTLTGLSLGLLAAGTRFDLERWRVASGPLAAGPMIAGRTHDTHDGLRPE